MAFVAVSAAVVLAGPEQDFDAAIKAGKPLSAEAAYLKIQKSGSAVAPIRHFQAADVAAQLGKATLRKDRLMLFLRMERGWCPEVEQALWTLVSAGAGLEYYERLVANVKSASPRLWIVGRELFDRFAAANRHSEVIRLSDVLLSTFSGQGQRDWVMDALFNASQRTGAGYPEKELVEMLLRHPGLEGRESFSQTVLDGQHRAAFAPDFAMRYAARHGGAISDRLLGSQIARVDDVLNQGKPVEGIEGIASSMVKARKVCFDGRHPEAAWRYFRVAVVHRPDLFFKTVATNGYVSGASAMYGELASSDRFKTDEWYRSQVISSRDEAIRRRRFSATEIQSLVDAAPDQFDGYQLSILSSLGDVEKAANKAGNPAPIAALAAKFPSRSAEIEARFIWHFANARDGAGDFAAVKRAIQYEAHRSSNFDYGPLNALVSGCSATSVADKLAFCKSIYALSGYNNAWKDFRRRAEAGKQGKDAFYGDASVKAFAAAIRDDALPGDPVFRAERMLVRAKDAAQAHAAAAEFAKVYTTPFGGAKDARDNRVATWFVGRYFELVRNASVDDCRKWFDFALPRASKTWMDYGALGHVIRRANDDAALRLAQRRRRAEVFGSYDVMAEMVVPPDSERPYEGIDMRKMSARPAYDYMRNNFRNLKTPARRKILLDFLASRPIESNSVEVVYWVLDLACCNSLDASFLEGFPLERFGDLLLTGARRLDEHPDSNLNFLRIARRMGRLPEISRRYLDWAKTQDPVQRYCAVRDLLCVAVAVANANGEGSHNECLVDDVQFRTLMRTEMLPALKAIPPRQAGILSFDSWLWDGRVSPGWNWAAREKGKDAEAKREFVAALREVFDRMADLVAAGADNARADTICVAWHDSIRRSAETGDAVRVSRLARRAGASVVEWAVGATCVRETMELLKKSGNAEALFLYVDALPERISEGLAAEASKCRAEIASTLPGIYPVDENDPAYPLYVAADELSRKNSERAWQILQDPRNQAVFERVALKLPIEFVAWGVEQMRLARGPGDALLLKARQIATAILAQEGKVAAELVAAMILSRAEGYRDQQNFEAAKLEYQSIRDNPVYHATKYGKKAMFRATDMQISSGNMQGVEATLEYWLSQNDREVQAEAHYFLAKIAFIRKDYDECIKQLRMVFGINFTHTEARFLQGEWKLATNSEVDDTEVLVGHLGDRSVIKPGNQFTISVQDANLSVAGGGASIPVIVSTKPGNDVERINLYPTSRDPSNFKGIVEVVLGKACPSNRVLEVRGDDTVSYVIDPAFLRARALPVNTPKVLRVIDDAKLVIGAGAPRAEERKTESDLTDLLGGVAGEGSGLARQLRPGNPLYVVVRDRDRSHGGAADTVRVAVGTSSGDTLEGFELKEEGPFTGVFRGKIATSLPPPRAFASDTAAGMNEGDVINSGKSGGWKSLSDGRPGKWFEVDTMGAFAFSEIDLASPGAADIKSIKLVGRMGKRSQVMGQFPAETEDSRLGLRLQQGRMRDVRNSLVSLRDFCRTDRAPKPTVVKEVSFRAQRSEPQGAFYSGPCIVPEGVDALRLRIAPKSTRKDALRGLWVALAIDGEEVFSGQGPGLQNAVASSDITAGCHQFEFAVLAHSDNDDFDLMWEPLGAEPAPVPADWFDASAHAALRSFVKDRATIVRTPTGFKATFDKPERMRSFRWEFADVKSPDVVLTRISARDGGGGTILPVASDFSDARANRTLEVAPGDVITVKYEDEETSSGETKVIQRQMRSSFNDAEVRFVFEEANERGGISAYDALRFLPGDTLVLVAKDPDCDTTDAADSVEVTVRDRLGRSATRRLIECRPPWAGGAADENGMHTGLFMGILKTCAEGNTNAPASVLRVKSDDLITVSYEDRENTDPGVPCLRETRIFAARPAEPEITLFNVRKTQEVDTSADAKAKLERIRRRPGNENVKAVLRDVMLVEPMAKGAAATTNGIPFNVSAGAIPLRVTDRSRARHTGSRLAVDAVAHSELARAEAEGREPDRTRALLRLGGSVTPSARREDAVSWRTRSGLSERESRASGTFGGCIRLSLGPADPNEPEDGESSPVLCVTGSDRVDVRVLDEAGEPVLTRTLQLVSDAKLELMDSSFAASRDTAHVGESFFVMVDDADHDTSDGPDRVELTAKSVRTGVSRRLILSETMPHSGVFTGRLRPVMFAPGETIPSVATGGVASVNETLTEDRFAIGYGDRVVFTYADDRTLPGSDRGVLSATGTVFNGANGDVRLFSKRFADRDTAVLVQFRLAECLFEQAKEYRRLKQSEKSQAAIAEGKFILEEALKNYPDSSHVAQGEYLLANLYQELAAERKEAGETEKAVPLYQEALSRFSQILGTWPDCEYAARSQYHKALCLEMLKDYNRASEEYVKMTYLYPESDLVGEATIRLATYYYAQEKRYDISGHIYRNFQQRFPQHEKAARAMFMAGSCYVKQAETLAAEAEAARAGGKAAQRDAARRAAEAYREAIKTFVALVETYHDGAPKLRAQALYWAGDVSVRVQDYAKAYVYLKRTVYEFPETEWARRARGLLLQEGKAFEGME